MTLDKLYTLLKQTGYPVAYYQFESKKNNPPPNPPYIIYWTPESSSYGADTSKALVRNSTVHVELYTTKKDLQAETKLEAALDSKCIHYDKNEAYIESEKLYQILYSFELIEKL